MRVGTGILWGGLASVSPRFRQTSIISTQGTSIYARPPRHRSLRSLPPAHRQLLAELMCVLKMASGLFVDPTTLLRLTPLVSSTCTLWFAWDQRVMYSTFTHPDLHKESSAILPLWWRKILEFPEIERVLLPLTITAVTSIANIRKYGALLQAEGSWAWYAAGAALAVGQYVFQLPTANILPPGCLWGVPCGRI